MASSGKVICPQHAINGPCTIPNCSFAHEAPSENQLPPDHLELPMLSCLSSQDDCPSSHDPTLAKPDPGNAVSVYPGWSQLLGPRRNPGMRAGGIVHELSADQMERFLGDALKILEIASSEIVQKLIGDLASNRGLRRIAQLVEGNFIGGDSPYCMSFKRHCVPFLQVVAHEEMRASFVLEREVATILNFIYGPDGRRGIGFFTRVAESLSQLAETEDQAFIEEALLAAGAALFGVLNLNQGSGVQSEFGVITITFAALLVRRSASNNYTFRSAQEVLNRIQVLLMMADAVPKSTPYKPNQVTPKHPQPQQEADLPGELSREGPRHDNDHADIAKIKILPTSEEIQSDREEYLPQRALDYPHHLEGISRLIDSQFRLLRAETSGQIREAVRNVQDDWKDLVQDEDGNCEGEKGKKRKVRGASMQTIIYTNAQIEKIQCAQRDGVVLGITIDQPSNVTALDDNGRKEWWGQSQYLAVGSLLCLVDGLKRSTFLVVCDRVIHYTEKAKQPGHSTEMQLDETDAVGGVPGQDLASNPKRAMIALRFADQISEADIENVFTTVAGNKRVLVEFPGLLLTSFDPALKCLQQVSKTRNVPFAKWLAPSAIYDYFTSPSSDYVHVPPPLYMTKPGMVLSLKSVTSLKSVNSRPLSYSITSNFRVKDLERATTLDCSQCEALIAGLSRELAFIQGPPGTGKSYLGVQFVKILLDNRDETKIGPILYVCDTNHTLDEFLENLLKDGITNIVRIGSDSKSATVTPLSLQAVARQIDRTHLENDHINTAKANLVEAQKDIKEACKQLLHLQDPHVLKSFLEARHPQAFDELFGGEDKAGFSHVGREDVKPDAEQIVGDWVNGRGSFQYRETRFRNRPIEQLLMTSISDMSRIERLTTLEHWYEQMKELVSDRLLESTQEHATEFANLSRQKQEQKRRYLRDSHVIGVTATGFASHYDLIRSVSVKVLICEEATEVLETHILSALLPTLEHTVLIGDHAKLQPQIMNHDLSMDTSLFERVAEIERYAGKRFPVARLDRQHRIPRPIPELAPNSICPDFEDCPSTVELPQAPGVARRLFWMDHRKPEAGSSQLDLIETSYANEYEAGMVVQLVRHLSRQGVYKTGDIAVLSLYPGQLLLLRQKLASMFDAVIGEIDQEELNELEEEEAAAEVPTKQVRRGTLLNEVTVSTVDNFQGEDAKVVIISMAQSGKESRCDFLKMPNKINVLLSRAINGMYIFGNAETCGRIPMISQVLNMLINGGNIGRQLELRCPRHPDLHISVSDPADFHLFSPEGGCNEYCQWRLSCGHSCVMKCHSKFFHESTVCFGYCDRLFQHCTHACPTPCGIPCGECNVLVTGVRLPCGHIPPSIRCHELQNLSGIQCNEVVSRTLSACGHTVQCQCWQKSGDFQCCMRCEAILPCGHQCESKCRQCTRKKTEHGHMTVVSVRPMCSRPCGRYYTNCSHKCIVLCHGAENCPPCTQPCEIGCRHSSCGMECADSCAPCAELCSWTCIHRSERCELPCAVPCEISPCSERCQKILHCGHQCPSLCGEQCPSKEFCPVCASDDVKSRKVDLITFKRYSDIDLNINPIIVPTCGHFYSVETYDGHMGMENSYILDENNVIIAPRPLHTRNPDASSSDDYLPEKIVLKNCPDCRAPLRDIQRYNRILKTALLDESTRRFCANSQVKFLILYQKVSLALESLQANRADFVIGLSTTGQTNNPPVVGTPSVPRPIADRIMNGVQIGKTIKQFIRTVSEENQPYSKVQQIALSMQRRRGVKTLFAEDSVPVQILFRIRAQNLLLEATWGALWDLHVILTSSAVDPITAKALRKQLVGDLKQQHQRCAGIIEECRTARLEKYEVEARIHSAQCVGLHQVECMTLNQSAPVPISGKPNIAQNTADGLGLGISEIMRNAEYESLDRCDKLCDVLRIIVGPLKDQVEQARIILGRGTIYRTVSAEEKRLVHEAMWAEFNPSGNWYTCQNGHPFMMRVCGGSRENAYCPECGAQISSSHSGLLAGVRRAAEFVEMDRQMNRRNLR